MKDLTNLKTFIIDSKNPIEIDDAISLEIDNNIKNIWIHVSYPSKIFEFNSELDINAKKSHESTSQQAPTVNWGPAKTKLIGIKRCVHPGR